MALERAATGPWNFKEKLQFQFKKYKQKRDRPFIVPTAFGFIFGLMVLLLLMMALGSTNNVLYIFVFFLVSVSLSAMVLTNNNLERVRITEISTHFVFADAEATFKVLLTNRGLQPSHMIDIKVGAKAPIPQGQTVEIEVGQEKLVLVRGEIFSRGLQQLPKLQISSTFPFGLLRSWKIHRNKGTFLVYPARRGSLPFPQSSQNSQFLGEAGLFRDLREYQSSDSPRRIDWRATMKHGKILIKNFETQSEKSNSFHWNHTAPAGSFEARISQMAQWVDLAEKTGVLYSMEVGLFKTEVLRGSDHWQNCLQYLALLKPETQL